MDTSNALVKIAEIVLKVKEFIDKVKYIVDKFCYKINKYLAELERIINKAIEKINSGLANAQKWLEMKTEPIIKNINDALDGLKKKIDGIIEGIKAWYEKVMLNIKMAVVKATLAKLGQELPDEAVEGMAKAIPHPDIASFLPEFNIELAIPNLSEMFNLGQVQEIKIPRLPLPFGTEFEEESEESTASSSNESAVATA